MRRLARGALLLLLVLGGSPLRGEPSELSGAKLVPCAGPRFHARELPTGSVRASGFHFPELSRSGRRFAWARRQAEIWLVLDDRPAERRLVLTAAGVVGGQVVSARLNGVDLGERTLGKEFEDRIWELPRSALRPGLNRVVLQADVERRAGPKKRRLALAVGELRVEPDASGCAAARDAGAVELPTTLAAGTALVAPLTVPPEGRLLLGLGGEAGAVVDALVGFEGQHLPIEGAAAAGWRGGEIALPGCCGTERRLMIVARGPDAVPLETLEVDGDRSAEAWRRVCGTWAPPIIAVIALGCLFLLSAWRGWSLPASRWAPWVDVLLVVAVAMLVRWLYLAEYPHGAALSADAGEYLMRARALAMGHSDLLGDVYWHRWQTWLRPPGYYFFLAQLFKLGIESVATMARIQTGLWVATAVATYSLGYVLLGRGAALFAGLFFAVNLEAVTFAARICTEALFVPLLVPALVLLARLAKRPSGRLAFATGLLFGLAALVRSAPVLLVPGAALLIGLGQGFRRSIRPMAGLVLGMAVILVPWSVRNSVVMGMPMGVDNILVPNFLFARPDERYVDPGTYDPMTGEFQDRYSWRVKRAGERLASQPVLRDGLLRMAARPLETVRLTGIGLWRFFWPRSPWFAEGVGEKQTCRARAFAELVNWQTFPVLILGLAVMLRRIGDRSMWPVSLWFVVILLSTALLVPLGPADKLRYRFTTLPVLFAYAGWGLCYLHEALARRLERLRKGSGDRRLEGEGENV